MRIISGHVPFLLFHKVMDSLALIGDFSATLVGATNQPNVYPSGKAAFFYHFDPDLYQGEQLWSTLKAMLINAGRVSGCRLTTKYSSL
jgi:hypothetical protein